MEFLGKFSVAPLLGATDRHYRHFARLLSRRALLYTEMVNSRAITDGRYADRLPDNAQDGPVALQLGGFDPEDMAAAAVAGERCGFCEINMNVGCPSPRGVAARFGVCLMAEPDTVARCVERMVQAVSVPVTVKCRLGIDEDDSLEHFCHFVQQVSEAGCATFIVHARQALLTGGVSTKQNRSLPPLRYADVYEVKRRFPQLNFVINGGIVSLEETGEHLQHVEGVMLGRAAYHDIFMLSQVDERIYGEAPSTITRSEFMAQVMPYIAEHLRFGCELSHLVRHLLGLYQGLAGAGVWRRYLARHAFHHGAGIKVVEEALAATEEFIGG